MKVKELIDELKKYPEDTMIVIENRDDDNGLTYIEVPWLTYKEEIKYSTDRWRMYYASYLHYDDILKNVLVLN